MVYPGNIFTEMERFKLALRKNGDENSGYEHQCKQRCGGGKDHGGTRNHVTEEVGFESQAWLSKCTFSDWKVDIKERKE